jgi:hypothetical protein
MKYEITVVGHRFHEEGDREFEVFNAFCSMQELIDHIDFDDDMDIYAISARRRPEYELAEEDNVIEVDFLQRERKELNFEDQS